MTTGEIKNLRDNIQNRLGRVHTDAKGVLMEGQRRMEKAFVKR
jgi:hypothetical protein